MQRSAGLNQHAFLIAQLYFSPWDLEPWATVFAREPR